MELGNRLFSCSMVRRLTARSGSKGPVHGTNLAIRLKALSTVSALSPNRSLRSNQSVDAYWRNLAAESAESNSAKYALGLVLLRPIATVWMRGASNSPSSGSREIEDFSSRALRAELSAVRSLDAPAAVGSVGAPTSPGLKCMSTVLASRRIRCWTLVASSWESEQCCLMANTGWGGGARVSGLCN